MYRRIVWWVVNIVQGSGRGLISVVIPVFVWKNYGKRRKLQTWYSSQPRIEHKTYRIQDRSFTVRASTLPGCITVDSASRSGSSIDSSIRPGHSKPKQVQIRNTGKQQRQRARGCKYFAHIFSYRGHNIIFLKIPHTKLYLRKWSPQIAEINENYMSHFREKRNFEFGAHAPIHDG